MMMLMLMMQGSCMFVRTRLSSCTPTGKNLCRKEGMTTSPETMGASYPEDSVVR